jgi:hypothetical protein
LRNRLSQGAYTLATAIACLRCGDDSGTYDASLTEIRNDVRLELSVAADGSGKLAIVRWFGSAAYGWEHCPRIHAAGTVNGRPLKLEDPGGWIPASSGPGLLDGDGGICRNMLYRFGPEALIGLTGPDVVFRLEDESGIWELQTPYLADELSIALATSTASTMIPDRRSEIALLPGIAALDSAGCSVSYRGELAHKTLVAQYASFDVPASAIERTDHVLAFLVPAADDSHGWLHLDCHRGDAWPVGIERCDGVAGCEATRANPSALKLEVSVSATGEPVTPDPTVDPAGWSSCWLSAEVSGGVQQTLTLGQDTCSGGLHTGSQTMTMTWGPPTSPSAHAALRVTEIGGLDLVGDFPAELELTIGPNTWVTPPSGCRVKLTRVERDPAITTQEVYVVQGTGSCTESAAPAPSNQLAPLEIAPFQFRAGVMSSP